MIKSWLQITLDTTPPNLKLYFPSVVTNDSYETITIEADEPLDLKQEIYIIDSKNNRVDYNFSLQEDKKTLIGYLQFNNLSKGIATMYVRLYDEVWNKSSLYTGHFKVDDLTTHSLTLKVIDEEYKIKLTSSSRKFLLLEKEMEINTESRTSKIKSDINERKLDLLERNIN